MIEYTVIAEWEDGTREVFEVSVESKRDVRRAVVEKLASDYLPGGRILDIRSFQPPVTIHCIP